jgi:hypothetical protein
MLGPHSFQDLGIHVHLVEVSRCRRVEGLVEVAPLSEVLVEQRCACPQVLVAQMVADILLVFQTAMV